MEMQTEFEYHAARAFFASAWADMMEENGATLRGEIMAQMPDTLDNAAIHAARTLRMDIERKDGRTISQLMDYIGQYGNGDRLNTAEYFGHYAAMQAMGHGVGLYDAFGKRVYEAVFVPYIEFGSYSLENDYVLTRG